MRRHSRQRRDTRARDPRSGAHERPVADAVGTPVGADRLAHVLLVRLVVALEPADAAVAFEDEQVRRDAVQEPAVVADDGHAPREIEHGLLERTQGVDVEIVRRLVEQEHVPAGTQELREMHAVALAAGEVADLLLLIRAAEIERRRVRACVPCPRTDEDVLLATGDLFPHILFRVERVSGLGHVRELHGLADREAPAIRLFLAGDQPEEGRLPGAIGSDDADDPPARQREAQIVEEQLVAVGLAESLRLNDEVAEPGPGRDRDLELALAEPRIFRQETLVRLDARLALGLSRARRCAHPLELARERLLARGLLLLLYGEPRALLVEP